VERRRSKTSLVRKELAAGVTQANRRTEGPDGWAPHSRDRHIAGMVDKGVAGALSNTLCKQMPMPKRDNTKQTLLIPALFLLIYISYWNASFPGLQ